MHWNKLTSQTEWESILQKSNEKPQLVFKHSTRCSISSMALSRFENSSILENDSIDFHLLDLIQFRMVSNQIASDTGVRHQSPQILLIRNGKSIFDSSHGLINAKELIQFIH